jgi:hypothetical protein
LVTFDFFDYCKNPIAEFCTSKNKDIKIYTLDDMMPYIQKLPHSKKCLDLGVKISIGNQLRLYLSTLEDDFLYVDADCFLPESSIDEIEKYKNCVYYNAKYNKIENGTFFHSDKDCEFNKFYLEKYNELGNESTFRKINIFHEYPYKREADPTMSGDMKLIKPDIRHFFISNFYKFKNCYPDISVIKYSFEKISPNMRGAFWQLQDTYEDIYSATGKNNAIYFFNTTNPHISQVDLFNLWKEQLNYAYQKELQFEMV